MCSYGFISNSDYFKLEGKNSLGKPIPNSEILVDIDNLIDYMLIVFYTGSFDAPISQFIGNDKPNNYYAIANREDKSQGFEFFVHDMEHSMMIDAVTVGQGINENRVSLGTITGERRMEIKEFKYFNPQWLHHRLSANQEYRIRFADRAALHLSNNGVFTEKRATERFDERASQIEMAIIGESARWGDTKQSKPYTKDNAWIPELNEVRNNFFTRRTNIVTGQLRQEGLYISLEAPEYYSSDTLFNISEYKLTGDISIVFENPNNSGEIYYTLNGQDPRLVGGNINAKSIHHGTSLSFSGSAIIKSRVKKDGEWSALRTLTLVSTFDDLSNLKITEVHYHPKEQISGADTLKSQDQEFIEFKNIGETSLNLSGVKIDSAVRYTFPKNSILSPGQFYVIASKPAKFYETYGFTASGNFKGNLSNGGEEILVTDIHDNMLINFRYDDADPWSGKADGDGPSLASNEFNPTGKPEDHTYWRRSVYDGGTPFRDDELITALDEKEEDAITSTSLVSLFPNPANDFIQVSVARISTNALLKIRFLNLNGWEIFQADVRNNSRIALDPMGISKGLKLVTVQHHDFFETAKVLIR